MSENLIDELISDSNYKTSYNSDYILSQCQHQDDSASFLNLIDQDIISNNQIMGENYSPNYSLSESTNNSSTDQPAKPDVKSNGLNQNFEEMLLSKLPQIFAIERASIQYQVIDQMYPSLSKSFQNCFNSPVLDLLVVVLDPNKLVSFYQGYFAGIPRLTNELINLTGKYWKSLISNNDDNAWENHFRSVYEKSNSKSNFEPEFEAGPVIRCRLRASSSSQFNQQYNYFFVQPCSYIIQLPVHFNNKSMEFSSMDTTSGGINNYLVSYINIVRECDTEYALKGSAAASLQKVITNSTFIQRQKLDNILETPTNKQGNNRNFQRNIHNTPIAINNQLSVNISSPAYSNIEQSTISASAPLTYPFINNQRSEQYNKSNLFTNAQIQHQMSQQRQSSIPMNHNQYMNRGTSMSTVDPNQHRYSSHYDNSHSLQYILENRNNGYPNVKQHSNHTHLMGQHGQIYKNPIQSNHTYFLPAAQSAQQTCSLNSPTSFMSARHVIQMPSNSILMSSDQYFHNSHQINLMDSVQVTQPMMTVVQPMSASSNHSPANYYYTTAQNQILHNPLHINTSLTNQSQFVSSSVSPYCNPERPSMTHQDYSNASSRNVSQASIKQENYDINICQNDWLSNPILDSRNSSLMSSNSISIDIVEEILQAEEAKSENKSLDSDLNKSNTSDSLIGYLNDFMSNTKSTSAANSNINNNDVTMSSSNVQAAPSSPQLVTLNPIKSEGKISEFRSNNNSCKSHNSLKANPVLNLKMEILKNLDSTQRLQIKKIVNQFKNGKLKKMQMYQQINQFLTQALGSQTYSQQVIKFWNTHQQYPLTDNVDSTLSGFNYSHVVQSPEEGPGISPTEQAAQSTTDPEEDKEVIKNASKTKTKEKTGSDSTRKHGRSKSNCKNSEASIYSITSTTPTGVLETLLNEHDNPMTSDKSLKAISANTSCKLSISSTSKNQLSLDQLLMDDEFTIYPNNDDRFTKKASDSLSVRSASTKHIKSQPSTPLVPNNMGVLETLLNQKTPSMFTLRQMSTENILKHSKPSRQNSSDMFIDEANNSFDSTDKDKGLKKNSLLITLLNTSQNPEKGKVLNSSSNSFEGSSPSFPNKRCRMLSGTQSSYDSTSSKKMDDKVVSNGLDVFDFVDTELSYNATDTQSTVVTSSQALSVRKPSQTRKSRKRRYSKDRSIDSDGSSDRLSSIGEKYMKTSAMCVKTEDKNVILTSLLENVKPRDIMTSVSSGKVILGIGKSEPCDYDQPTAVFDNQIVPDDNIDLEDIKIDDFDLENLIDISENYDESTSAIMTNVDPSLSAIIQKTNTDSSLLTNKVVMTNSTMSGTTFDVVPPVYKMVGPIIKSDPIVPMSKQSILRVSDKNSFLLSAIQSTPTSNSISVECLDSERERLLRQQQQQKVCMGGDKPPVTMGHQLSLDMLSKQMKEVGPNVMVELSVPSDVPRSRKGSISRSLSAISTQPISCNSASTMSTSPTCRSSFQPNCPMDMVTDSTKVVTTSVNHVNHQQVRDGLRLLVTNRSAQNNSKNNLQVHRNNSSGGSEMLPQPDISAMPKSAVKDVIHYPSSIAKPSNCHKDPSYPYSNQSYSASISNSNDPNTSDILEDSLVNDVFGLEELVNSKSRHSSASMEYSKLNLPESASGDHSHQIESMGFVPGTTQSSSSSVVGSTYSRPPPPPPGQQPHHHHHYTHHYHHQHHHHHHHTSSNPPLVNESNVSTTKDKPSVTSGLLETLLSR